ncbi:MAG: hypothetical protein AMXMBFR64_59880 [Myxococcales bacterium]
MITLRWHGHAAFTVTAGALRVLVDPYRPGALGGRFRLPPIEEPADLVLITHWHEDHSWVGGAQRGALVADTTGEWLGVPVTAVAAFHDREGGARMGLTRMLAFSLGGLRVAHLGDIGVPPTDAQWEALGPVDVLLVPAGGTWTIDPAEAVAVAVRSGASWVVPMHVANPSIDLALAPVEDFIAAWEGAVQRIGGDTVTLSEPPASPVAVLLACGAGANLDTTDPPPERTP